MKRTGLTLILLVSAAGVLAASAAARPDVVVTRLAPDAVPQAVGEIRPVPTCEVGNLGAPYWAISDWITPLDRYALIFDPMATCQDCPLGVRVKTIHVVVQTSADCELTMRGVLMTVQTAGRPLCRVPGDAYCGSLDVQVSLPTAGVWDIALPVTCACADPDFPFALKVVFAACSCSDGTVPDLVLDDYPSACTSYNDWGEGWVDLVGGFGFPGNLMIWGEAECCADPVAAETKTWSELKAIYR